MKAQQSSHLVFRHALENRRLPASVQQQLVRSQRTLLDVMFFYRFCVLEDPTHHRAARLLLLHRTCASSYGKSCREEKQIPSAFHESSAHTMRTPPSCSTATAVFSSAPPSVGLRRAVWDTRGGASESQIPRSAITPYFSPRTFVNLAGSWTQRELQYTKYRIAKQAVEGSSFDDMYLSDPKRSDFVKFTKETPLFLRFLKLICDLEKRQNEFVSFAKRCEEGLVVEKDVYLTKEELLKSIWQNGYTETEINAFEIAFPADYRFHYPELAVLFSLSEEDCYKFCLRQRATNPENLVELIYRKPTNLLSSYGLMFLLVWNGLSNQVLSNAWFYSKTFPFGAVFFMLAAYFRREIRAFVTRHSNDAAERSLATKHKYDEIVLSQMKKYANDARCLDYLSSFKDDVQKQLAKYHHALVLEQRELLTAKLTEKLAAIQRSEAAIESSLQQVMVQEVVREFKHAFGRDGKLEGQAFSAAVQLLGEPSSSSSSSAAVDPVGEYFRLSLKQLQTDNIDESGASTEPAGRVTPIVSRVLAIFRQKEKEFLDQFTVKSEESSELRQLFAKCTLPDGFDFSRLSEVQEKRLDRLYSDINNRVGFELPHESSLERLRPDSEHTSAAYAHYVNDMIDRAATRIRIARLKSFATGFA